MKQYPIWHQVEACIYKSSKSYGAKNTSQDTILVGSSINNSHELGTVVTTRRFYQHEKYGSVCVFRLSVDNKIIKSAYFKNNDGKAGELIKIVKGK